MKTEDIIIIVIINHIMFRYAVGPRSQKKHYVFSLVRCRSNFGGFPKEVTYFIVGLRK